MGSTPKPALWVQFKGYYKEVPSACEMRGPKVEGGHSHSPQTAVKSERL